MGGRSGPAVPPAEAGRTRRAETKSRTWTQSRLRHAAGGLKGATPTPPDRSRRPTPPRLGAVTAAQSARSAARLAEPSEHALSNPDGRRGGVRAHAVGQPPPCPPNGSSVPSRKPRRCDLWRVRQIPPVCAQLTPAFRLPAPAGQCVMRSKPASAETPKSDSAPRQRCESAVAPQAWDALTPRLCLTFSALGCAGAANHCKGHSVPPRGPFHRTISVSTLPREHHSSVLNVRLYQC